MLRGAHPVNGRLTASLKPCISFMETVGLHKGIMPRVADKGDG